MLVGEPQVWPLEKSRNRFEPTLVLLTTEKAIRFIRLTSEIFERRKRFSQACQLPITLWMPRPQSSKRQYQTQMSMEFQLTVWMPTPHRRKRQRRTSFSACPAESGPPKTMPHLASRKTRSLVSL